MANECFNFLKAMGPQEALKLFHQRMTAVDAKGYSSSFQNFVPMPAALESQEDFNWRSWCYEHWGTKWDPPYLGDLSMQKPERVAESLFLHEYSFETAWNAPEKWLEKASEQSPGMRLELYYFEPGLSFAGYYIYLDGKCLRGLYVCSNEPEFREIGLLYFEERYKAWRRFQRLNYIKATD